MSKSKEPKVVRRVDATAMDGENPLVKRINAYLTERFVMTRNVPADECLEEARAVVNLCRNYLWECKE